VTPYPHHRRAAAALGIRAGNSGGGDDDRDGKGGSPDTVLSPGNAKNIISVGRSRVIGEFPITWWSMA